MDKEWHERNKEIFDKYLNPNRKPPIEKVAIVYQEGSKPAIFVLTVGGMPLFRMDATELLTFNINTRED